jgi:hypothetical protein
MKCKENVKKTDEDLITLIIISILDYNPSSSSTKINYFYNIIGNTNNHPERQLARHSISVPPTQTDSRSTTFEVPWHLISGLNPRMSNIENSTRKGNNIS